MNDNDQTPPSDPKFDRASLPDGALLHERRWRQRRDESNEVANGPETPPKGERRAKKERRRRIDPTTFEKQYTDDELEFMNAMQRYKVQTGKSFPTHGEVLMIAQQLGYRKGQGPETPTAEPHDDRPSSK
ncbi:MAG: hypothetical protein P4L84_38120 [Isosphaeraceae bacterium]|nr:hypothetical protein [Isosphaeraceae bacterium]